MSTVNEDSESREKLYAVVKDIENRVEFDLPSSIGKLQEEITKLREDLNIWNLLEDKAVPYVYEKLLYKLIKNLNEKTSYSDRVNCFKKLNYGKNIKPLTEKLYSNPEWRRDKILKCTTFLRNAKEFYNVAKTASIETQPIFYYYSTVYLFSFLVDSFVDFDNSRKHHGIYVKNMDDIHNIRFEFAPHGFFERLVHGLTILNYPSSFSSFITDFDESKHTIVSEYQTELSIMNKKEIPIDKLIKHNFKGDEMKVELRWRIFDFHNRHLITSNILKDFILIFISCNVARYNPRSWKQIYLGEENDLIFHFNKAFQNINTMVRFVNDIFFEAENARFPGFQGTVYL